MSAIGEVEKKTQARVLRLFVDELGYEYLGSLHDTDNRNVDEGRLEHFLFAYQEYPEDLIRRAVAKLLRTAGDSSRSLYDRNRDVYELLRYGVPVRSEAGALTETVWLIDWKTPRRNQFAVAEEVSVKADNPKAHGKRPDLVLYVNGIALGVLELKRSTVSVAEGIRQNIENQRKEFIQPFFSTMQLLLAGNDTEGLRYGSIDTREKYYLSWKEPGPTANPIDLALRQLCDKTRLLELIHDFVVYDSGAKKLCRHNQYFAVRAAQDFVKRREGGIIWHTQGSGKSLTMVWLAKWIRENVTDARVLILTDRTELDQQIESVFLGVGEDIYRTTSGADLIAALNASAPWLLCSLIHKFSGKDDGASASDLQGYLEELYKARPPGPPASAPKASSTSSWTNATAPSPATCTKR